MVVSEARHRFLAQLGSSIFVHFPTPHSLHQNPVEPCLAVLAGFAAPMLSVYSICLAGIPYLLTGA